MKKRMTSLLLSLVLCLNMLPAAAFAADSPNVSVSIGMTTLESGKYYVAASGSAAVFQVIAAVDDQPEDDYLAFDGQTLTVHGQVSLTSGGPSILNVTNTALTVTGEDGSQLSLTTKNTSPTVKLESASLQLTGAVDFTAGTTGDTSTCMAIPETSALTTEDYSGDFTVSGKIGAVNVDGTLSIMTDGAINLSRSTVVQNLPVVSAKEVTLQGKSINVTGDGTLLSSYNDLSVTVTEDSLALASATTTEPILKATNITLSAPENISLTSAFEDALIYDHTICASKLVLNDAKTATLKSTGKLMGSVTEQIDSHVGKLTITQEGKTTVIENGASVTYDGDITTAGLDFSSDLPTAQATYLAGDGTAVFTPATSESPATLTLNNATAGNIQLGANAVNIVVEGENTVGQISANGQNINISGTGSLKLAAAQIRDTTGEVKIDIEGDLTAENNGSIGTVFNKNATVSARSIRITSPYAFQGNGAQISASLTATDGDIYLDGVDNQSFTNIVSSLTLQAPKGSITSKNACFDCSVTATARDNISAASNSGYATMRNGNVTLTAQNGDISICTANQYAAAISIQGGQKAVTLSAPNGKIAVSGANGAIVSSLINSTTVTVEAKEVELTSSALYTPTLKADKLNLSADKITITGNGGQYSDYAVVRGGGTIQSDDLLIRANTGYAAAANNGTVLNLQGAGLVIGNLYSGVTHDDTITVVAPASEDISTSALGTALNSADKTVLSAGNGFVLVDPTEKTLLLHDATLVNNPQFVAIVVPDGVTTVTIEGTLTISTLNSIDLSGCESVVFKPDVMLKIADDGVLSLPSSVTLDDLKKLDLSCDGIIVLNGQGASSYVIRVTYNLDGGTNAADNPALYLKSTKDENTVALAAPTKSGYDFKGWYTDAAYENKLEALTKDIDADAKLTLYAKWAKAQQTGGSSSSGGGSSTGYGVTVGKTENGSVSVEPKNAKAGATVTVTVTPDQGYTAGTVSITDKNGKTVPVTKKSGTQYTFTMPSSKVDIKVTFAADNTAQNAFVDVKTSDYFYDAVRWAAEKGITSGTDSTHFAPDKTCTRAEIVTFLWRAAGSPVVDYAMDMQDVPADAYYAEAVRWALSEHITTGISANRFAPNATCTRAQSVAFLWRAAGSPVVNYAMNMQDVPADAYYAEAVRWALSKGVTTGVAADRFAPNADCTRAQIVCFLYRANESK